MNKLTFISNLMNELNIPYEFGEWTDSNVPNPYFVGEYNEYMTHSAVLMGLDDDLSSKWETLWKWYIGLFLGIIGCIVVMLIFPLLGALAVFGAIIGVAVVSILKLVYLYRTAKVFREYQPDDFSPIE